MHGKPILGYESLKELFMLFKVKNNMLKCWLDTSGCGIIKIMHDMVFSKTKTKYVSTKFEFFFISVDEVNTIEN
jgi:hypothetical protein